jgi:hypothetical protein
MNNDLCLESYLFYAILITLAPTPTQSNNLIVENSTQWTISLINKLLEIPNPLPTDRDVIKDEIGRKLPSGRPFRPDVRARPRLPRGRGFTRGRVFTVRGRGKNRVRADSRVRPRGRKK